MSAEFEIELARVVDRLRTMPLRTLPAAAEQTFLACQHLLRLLGDDRPLPRLADRAAGDQLAIIAAECRGMDEAAIAEATAALVALRRAL